MKNFKTINTPKFQDDFNEIKKIATQSFESRKRLGKKKQGRQEALFKKVVKTIQLLSANPRHPGLKTHEYNSMKHPYDPKGKVFEAYVENHTPGAYRLFWCYGPLENEITLVRVTPHP